MTKIKICGLKRTIDADFVNKSGADYAGFIFWEKSSRNLTFEMAKAIRERLEERICTVGVFVNENPDRIIELVREDIISCVQLHGTESNEDILKIREAIPKVCVIIKAFEVKDERDVQRANESLADMVLIDSGKGSGKTFDWMLLEGMKRDYFLAGGLSAENVGDAVLKLHPYAVDVSSMVETNGFKDNEKIKSFCQAVKEADRISQ